MRRPLLSLLAAAVLLAGATAPASAATPTVDPGLLPGNIVVEWNAIAQDIVQPPAGPGMPMMSGPSMSEAVVYLAYVQTAVYDALVSIEGGYAQYIPSALPVDAGASREAAVATAAYTVLTQFFPSFALEGKYAASLAAIPDGPAKAAGIIAGQLAADRILALRANDGRGASGTYTPPPPGPGVWQPTMFMPNGMPAPPIDPWVAVMTPFTLESPSQFRPDPPPALDSTEWATQLNEVKAIGGAGSVVRTPTQSEVAMFWTANTITQFNSAYRALATERSFTLLETARLMAMGNIIGTDTLIACFDSKYTYSFWRPVTAIRNAGSDGNPDTVPDPLWMPFLPTPNHPEYVAGHACFMSGQAELLTAILGTDQIALDLSSTATGTVRHYVSAADLREEIVNARTWGGMHYRGSSEIAVALGQSVARHALGAYFGVAAPGASQARGRPLRLALTGSATVPVPGDPDGSGTAMLSINPGLHELCYDLAVQDVGPLTVAHIHRAPKTGSGPVVASTPPSGATGGRGCARAERDLLRDMVTNPRDYYIDVHNAAFPAGALRAQLRD